MRDKKRLSNDEKAIFLSLKPDDINIKLLDSLFSRTFDTNSGKFIEPKFYTFDEFELTKGEYFNNETIVTNCGLFITNKYLVEPHEDLISTFGYINKTIDKSEYGKINQLSSRALLEGKIKDSETYIGFLNRLCQLVFMYNTQICSSITLKSMKPDPDVIKLKNKLEKQYENEIKNNDIVVYSKIESECVKLAKEKLQNDPSMELYESGARGGFDSSYKNAMISRGPIFDNSKGKWHIMKNPLSQGMDKEDIPISANAVVAGVYPKSLGTAECGYRSKQLSAAYQSVKTARFASNCKSKSFEVVELVPDLVDYYMYMYMIEGENKFTLLTPDNASKYINKVVKFRSPLGCCSKDLCNICAGERFNMLGISNIGLTTSKVSNSMVNARMKKFHVSTVQLYKIDPDKVFL